MTTTLTLVLLLLMVVVMRRRIALYVWRGGGGSKILNSSVSRRSRVDILAGRPTTSRRSPRKAMDRDHGLSSTQISSSTSLNQT